MFAHWQEEMTSQTKKKSVSKLKEQETVILQQYLYKQVKIKNIIILRKTKQKPVPFLQYGIMWYLLSATLVGCKN